MKKIKFLNTISRDFHIYKMSFTMSLWGLSALLSILGNIFGILFLVLAFLPIFAWGILLTNERKDTFL
ncbi:hypothetical protein [Clostridium sp.]|uniref:hypothetical protein n=1 Tax=Clostridium sp. TaxID=1506 RepID=UPI003D6C93FC